MIAKTKVGKGVKESWSSTFWQDMAHKIKNITLYSGIFVFQNFEFLRDFFCTVSEKEVEIVERILNLFLIMRR